MSLSHSNNVPSLPAVSAKCGVDIPVDGKTGHYYWLDLLRFIAAFLVLAGHYRGNMFVDYGSLPPAEQSLPMALFYFLTRLGHEAVMVFFVLSGFLVGGKLIERSREGNFSPRQYAIDRTVRIMLPLVSALLLIIIVNLICGQPVKWLEIGGNLLSLQGIFVGNATGPMWSLSYEVWFYVLGGAVAGVVTAKTTGSKIIGFIVALVAGATFTRLHAAYLAVWIFGAVSFISLPEKTNRLLLWGSIIAMTVLFAMAQGATQNEVTNPLFAAAKRFHRVLEPLRWVSICILIRQLVKSRPRFRATLAIERTGTRLAAFSYTLYLTHYPILELMQHFGVRRAESVTPASIALWVAAMAVAMAVAYLIYLGFEKHTPAVKSWLTARLK